MPRKMCLGRNFRILPAIITAVIAVGFPSATFAAILTLQPSSGTFITGSTLTSSIYLNTQGESINALDIILRFPPDKLQVVSPSTGQSIIGVWTSQPSFNNQTGEIRLQGGIPNGITVSQGLITTITFRVRQTGQAAIRFGGESKVLLNDGKGTDVLREAQGALYQLVLPPPAGPIVVSDTHPDPSMWYPTPTVGLRWSEPETGAQGYSFVLNEEPIDVPDDITDSTRSNVSYRNLADGRYYFHIKAMRNNVWGGITHFPINIDTTPPAIFPIEIIPGARTIRQQPVIQWSTTDSLSGVDHYELKIIPLSVQQPNTPSQTFFVEAQSPYIPAPLEPGTYDIIIRAYDRAGNYRDVTQRLTIVKAIFRFISDRGIEIRDRLVIPWIWFWSMMLIFIVGITYAAFHARRRHALVTTGAGKEFPDHIKEQLLELKKYREKYGKLMTVALLIAAPLLLGLRPTPTLSQQLEFGPPIVTNVSRDISNQEIFYIGGKAEVAGAKILVYLQTLQTGETQQFETETDRHGNWFYRHNSFLTTGNYLLWTQTKVGEALSPPSPQIALNVRATAIQFGATRISYETVYMLTTILLLLILIGLSGYTIFHTYHHRRKHNIFIREIREAEEAIRRGFAVLKRDIEAELAVVRKARLTRELEAEEREKERELLKDLERIESYIGKEIWDIEKVERAIGG